MPRTEPLPEKEIQNITNALKAEIARVGLNISETAKLLRDKYESSDTAESLARQIRQGTIPYWKIIRIADVLGYEIVWRKKD